MLKDTDKMWYSTSEVAKELRISTKTLYKRIASQEILAYRFGKNYKIHPADFNEYIKNSRATK